MNLSRVNGIGWIMFDIRVGETPLSTETWTEQPVFIGEGDSCRNLGEEVWVMRVSVHY